MAVYMAVESTAKFKRRSTGIVVRCDRSGVKCLLGKHVATANRNIWERESPFPSSSFFLSLEYWDHFYFSAWYKVTNKENISKVRWYVNQSIWQSVQTKIILRGLLLSSLAMLSFLKALIRVRSIKQSTIMRVHNGVYRRSVKVPRVVGHEVQSSSLECRKLCFYRDKRPLLRFVTNTGIPYELKLPSRNQLKRKYLSVMEYLLLRETC